MRKLPPTPTAVSQDDIARALSSGAARRVTPRQDDEADMPAILCSNTS